MAVVTAGNGRVPVVELISVVVCCYDVQQEDIFGLRVQSGYAELHLWKHLSVKWNLHVSIHTKRNFHGPSSCAFQHLIDK